MCILFRGRRYVGRKVKSDSHMGKILSPAHSIPQEHIYHIIVAHPIPRKACIRAALVLSFIFLTFWWGGPGQTAGRLHMPVALFSFKFFSKINIIVFLFVFDKYYLNMLCHPICAARFNGSCGTPPSPSVRFTDQPHVKSLAISTRVATHGLQ
jgi:hypothetical protein